MAVVVRLQGLNNEARLEDIRRFFHGLPIPEGGVHIIGGRTGEAFIIFQTERAGQLAMRCSGKQLRGSTVTLHKSSMDELKNKMRLELSKKEKASTVSEPVPQITNATECYAALVLSLVAAFQGQQSDTQTNQVRSPPVSTPQTTDTHKSGKDAIEERRVPDQTPPVNNQGRVSETARHRVEEQKGEAREVSVCKPGYLRLYGLPETITKEEVCWFLEGLEVVDVITDTLQGPDQYCLVKMASFKEAEEALKYSPKDLHVKVRLAHERMWENAMEQRENSPCSTFSEQDRFSPERHLHRNAPGKRACSPWGSPTRKRHRSNSSSYDTEYCVMVKNLPKTITENDVRRLFSCHDIPNSKILHPQNKCNEQTSTVFIIFTKPEEYTSAMNMNGYVVDSQIIDVSSITKQKLKDLMRQSRSAESERSRTCSTQAQTALSCIYARNFPAAVKKAEVKDFFGMHKIRDKDIVLLEDSNGNGIGETVIQFGCEKRAREALGLHRRHFGREQILLTCISPQQMKDILAKNQ